MTRYEAYIERDWREHGLAHLLVARIREGRSVDFSVFLADIWCLGVKDAYSESGVTEADLREMLAERLPEALREPIQPECAKKLIDGAVAYAERLGFAPHHDFRKANRLLSGLDASVCPTNFNYGREGRPCYVQGPDDSSERVRRVCAILEARLGPDGYTVELPGGEEDEQEVDLLGLRDELSEQLDAGPADAPRFHAFSGMVTALQLCPTPVPPTKLLEALGGSEGRVWKDGGEVKEFATLLMAYWNYVGDLVAGAIAPGAPPDENPVDVWAEDFPEEEEEALAMALTEWAAGFMRTTELWPEAWGGALGRPDLAGAWEMLRWWAEFSEENGARIEAAAATTPRRTLPLAVAALARALRPAGPPPPVA